MSVIGLKKINMTPEELCSSEYSRLILPYLSEVYTLKFDEEPDYNKLGFLLVKELMSINLTPSNEFDWNSHWLAAIKQVQLVNKIEIISGNETFELSDTA
jgi:hypothetical protein